MCLDNLRCRFYRGCTVSRSRRPDSSRVALETLDASDPLAILDDQANALELDTTPLGRFVITQRDGGLEKTAYALVTDLVAVARHVRGRA